MFLVRYRRRPGRRAAYVRGERLHEALWVLVPVAVVLVLDLWLDFRGAPVWAKVKIEKPRTALALQVTGKHFNWEVLYPGPDGKLGRTDIKFINDANGNPFGIDESDPAGKDDIVNAALKVPVGKPILLILRSRDVIHNFFVRELRMKQDIVPGMEIPFHFQADKVGTYEVPCSELCGLGHSQMRTTMQVMPEDEFEKWKKDQLAQK